jgi:hypothetical protein
MAVRAQGEKIRYHFTKRRRYNLAVVAQIRQLPVHHVAVGPAMGCGNCGNHSDLLSPQFQRWRSPLV